MPALVILLCLLCALIQVQAIGDGNISAVRFAHYEVLTQQYRNAVDSSGENIKETNQQLCREFLPKFLALAKENPDDEAALRCCEWIIVHCRAHDGDCDLCEAEAWQIVASNQSDTTRLPALCLEAAKSPSPAREKFLRSLPDDYRQPVEVHAYSFLALAELLAKKAEFKPDTSNLDDRASIEIREYFAGVEPNQLRQEIAEIFQHVLAHYSEVPYRSESRSNHECETLGEYAAMRLGEIKDSQLARRALPNVIEMPTQQFDHLSGN